MPKRKDLKKILIIGSGPIIISQACEFDYSGTQACKALREEGCSVVLINSNPATIMTDPETADRTYIEPITPEAVEKIIVRERPDALLPTLGGQTGLNTAVAVAESGILDRYGVEMIGASLPVIHKAEDRELFRRAMENIGLRVPGSRFARTVEEALAAAEEVGFPVIVRPSFTLGGTGSGVAYNWEELMEHARAGLEASMIHEIMLEESALGWKEYELEVMRDRADNVVIICSIENLDPMGVHTGESITVAPAQTLTDAEYQRLRNAAMAIMREIGVETGGSNVQFAVHPQTGEVIVIEMNPRVSRSSALASKATGFPIARIAAKLAIGYTLDEIPNDITRETLASFEPTLDYCVVKIPRWTFEKFPETEDFLTTSMKSVGETMAIGRTFKEALQKAVRSLEIGRFGLLEPLQEAPGLEEQIKAKLITPNSLRLFYLAAALKYGMTLEKIHQLTRIDPWFLDQIRQIVQAEAVLQLEGPSGEMLREAKRWGFSDRRLGELWGVPEGEIRSRRFSENLLPVYKLVDTCAAEFEAYTPYYYATYEEETEARPSDKRKVLIIGGGPNRIGQGIEFDYCCVHASFALREEGYESLMVNSNPETVSTDYDTSDKLYFEPLTVEDVISIYERERPEGMIVQFGGQTPLNIARELEEAGARVIGTTVDTIDLAEDRDRFRMMMEKMEIPMPESGMASNLDEALEVAARIGYPLMVRPSYVLGGRGMEVIYDEEMLERYVAAAVDVTPERPILIDRFLENALEAEADALSDGADTFVPAVMEHIEQAGVHSGDSACVIPPVTIPERHLDTIKEYTRRIAKELGVVGLMNMQYAIAKDVVYVLEANPRASRTVPLVSKVCNVSMARIATELMMGKRLGDMELLERRVPHFGAKEAVFPFNMFPDVDPLLGPEMRSTGEVLGMADSFGMAFYKAEEAARQTLPQEGTVLITVASKDRPKVLEAAKEFSRMGFFIRATRGTMGFLAENGIESELILKLTEGRPNIDDAIKNGEIQLVVNTPIGKASQYDDSYIRKAAIKYKIPYITTPAAASAAAKGIAAFRKGRSGVKSLQEYHADIKG